MCYSIIKEVKYYIYSEINVINDILFSKSFNFNHFHFESTKHSDNRSGIQCHYFAYMIKGGGKIVSEKRTMTVKEGDVFFLPYGLKYQSYWKGEPDIEFISLGFTFMPNFENKSYPAQIIYADEQTKESFFSACIETVNADAVGVFYTLVAKLMKNMASDMDGMSSALVKRAKEYIDGDANSKVSDIAKALNVSQSLLYLSFKKNSDVTLNEYKQSVLMERAKQLLISTDLSIEEISDRLGISSVSYFRKNFKKRFIVSPRDMRKRYNV